MLEQIISFITPGSLTDKFGFRRRVFTSWISLGLLLGLIMGIATVNSGVATPNGPIVLILQYTIGFPIIICLLGLIGLGLNSMRGGDAEYAGWYWWLFPIVTYLVIGFWFTMLFLGLFFALAGINSPTAPRRTTGRRVPEKSKNDIRPEIDKKEAKKFLDENVEILKQVQPLSIHERIILKLRNSPEALLEDILTEEEMEELVDMLLKALL